MKRIYWIILFGVVGNLISCASQSSIKADKKFFDENVSFAAQQTERMLTAVGDPADDRYPRTIDNDGHLITTNKYDWTSGFFPGNLWLLYDLTNDKKWKEEATKWTTSLEKLKTFTGHHDLGFMMYCSYGNAVRLDSHQEYKDILLKSAESLSSRYNDTVKAIKSWNYRKAWDGSEWFYPVIIDNMMNLELLFYASKISGDRKYYDIAVNHANTTLANQFRPDGSSYHVVNYEPSTGKVLNRQTCQGYSDNSTWSRGQAWAVYGYTMMYRETKDKKYLEAAKKFADYFISHLPEDGVPAWDFNAGQKGYEAQGKSYAKEYQPVDKLKDASATAIVASALFELAQYTDKAHYQKLACKLLKSLDTDTYRAKLGENGNFILMHCTGSLPHKSEIDKPLVYADYYYLEALTRYRDCILKKK